MSGDGQTKGGTKRAPQTGRRDGAGWIETKIECRPGAAVRRTSDILKQLISDESQQVLSVEQIVKALGPTSFGTSLMVFSIPEVLPIPLPGMSAAVVIPTSHHFRSTDHLGSGKFDCRTPCLDARFPVRPSRRRCAAILPFLERAERGTRARWRWASNPVAKRFLGLFILIMAAVIALPIPFTNMPAAISIFIISLGMVERDGVLISLGILLGLATIAMIGAVGLGILSLFGVTVA